MSWRYNHPTIIIIINGSLGVGKSSVAEELHWKFEKSVYLDGDQIGNVHPFEIYDDARITHLYRTLELLVGWHQQHGFPNFVINYVFEAPESLQVLIDLLAPLDDNIHVYWLTCALDEQERRIRIRQRDQLEWELQRFVELQQIQAAAAESGFIGHEVDTTHLTLSEVLLKAGRRRFRPIIMTTLTTILAMLPIAFGWGEGGELQAPMARVVVGGLASSALITLLAIPILAKWFKRTSPAAPSSEVLSPQA